MDLTHMSKFLVQGRDAKKVLNHICANNVEVPIGRIVYTQWLNERCRGVRRGGQDKAVAESAGRTVMAS